MKSNDGLNIVSIFILKAINAIVSVVVVISLLITGTYAAYALWDNNRVYSAAKDVQADMIKLKPEIKPEKDNGASFAELMAINPDVCAWITIDNTNIDYPVLQGENNLSYINTDVYGNFALAGSIYLDSRCDNTYKDKYSLLYGHHMADGNMFGDLDLFKEKDFFEGNRTGLLILPDRVYKLEIIACLIVNAFDDYIFEPEHWQTDIYNLLNYTEKNTLYIHTDEFSEVMQKDDSQIIALSTCSSEFTDARMVVLAAMNPYLPAE